MPRSRFSKFCVRIMNHEKLYPSSYWEYLGTQVIYKVGTYCNCSYWKM